MEKFTFFALDFKGGLLELSAEDALTFPPEIVKSWTLEYEPYLAEAALKVGRKLADARIGTVFGTDGDTITIAKGKAIAEEIVKGWDRTDSDRQPLPVTPENIGTLPLVVIRQVPRRLTKMVIATDAEIDALRKPTPPSTP